MSLAGIAAAFVSATLAAKRARRRSPEAAGDSLIQRLEWQVATHTDMHRGLDVRVTVYLLGYISVLAIEGSLFKDNIGLLSFRFMFAVAIVTTLGVISASIALRARRWITKPRTAEKILNDERHKTKKEVEYELATELASCESISRRKRNWSNVSLVLLAADVVWLAFGMAYL